MGLLKSNLFFTATDFTLKASDCPDTEFPVKILDMKEGCLWFKKDNKFKIPKGMLVFCMFVVVSGYCVTYREHFDYRYI